MREKLKRLDETIKDVEKQFDAVVASNYKEPKARVVNYTLGHMIEMSIAKIKCRWF